MTTVYVCTNHETIADGYISDRDRWSDEIDDALRDVCRFIDDAALNCVSKCAPHFHDWHGGKYAGVGKVFGGKQYGYRIGHVATLATDPSIAIGCLIQKADEMLTLALIAIGEREEAERAVTDEDRSYGPATETH